MWMMTQNLPSSPRNPDDPLESGMMNGLLSVIWSKDLQPRPDLQAKGRSTTAPCKNLPTDTHQGGTRYTFRRRLIADTHRLWSVSACLRRANMERDIHPRETTPYVMNDMLIEA